EEAAERVRASAISRHLTAGLVDWGTTKNKLQPGAGAPVRAVLNLVDDDPWLRKLRRAARSQAALENLAQEGETRSQPAVNLVFLAGFLQEAHSRAAAVRLLRRAQQKYPADFWVNFDLAVLLFKTKPSDPTEAVRFYQAALA